MDIRFDRRDPAGHDPRLHQDEPGGARRAGEKDAKLAQKLGQLQPSTAVFLSRFIAGFNTFLAAAAGHVEHGHVGGLERGAPAGAGDGGARAHTPGETRAPLAAWPGCASGRADCEEML